MIDFFTKKLFYVLGFVIIVMMLITYPVSNTAGAYYSEGSQVTFYGADNKTPIYSVNVPYGYSLNDLQNANIVTKSFWSNGDVIVSSPATINSWTLSSGVSYDTSENSLHILSNNTSQTLYLVYYIDTSLYRGKYLNYVVSINGINYFSSMLKESGVGGSGSSELFFDNKLNLRTYIYNDTMTGLTLDIRPNCPDFIIDYFMVYVTDFPVDIFLPYFNQQYVNQLYTKSGGTISDYKNWSQSLVNSLPYKFYSINQPSANLFYVNNSYVYDFGSIFNFASKKLDSYSYMTYDNVLNLKNTWSTFSSFNYDNSNILDVLKSIVRLFSLFFKLIFYVLSLPVSAVLDLFNLIIIILFPSNAWVYLT